MITISIDHVGTRWFAVAHHERRLVATATGSGREEAERTVVRCLPPGAAFERADESTPFAHGIAGQLARLEAGELEPPPFELCPDCVSASLAAVAQAASAIPRGYVTTYGELASAAGTNARVAGHIMATNPLYPLIPCHRVVGAGFALVGYAGRRDRCALRDKLERLRAEARGFTQSRIVTPPSGLAELQVHPVERVLARAAKDGLYAGDQIGLW